MEYQLINKPLLNIIVNDVKENFPLINGICQIAKNKKVSAKYTKPLIDMKIDEFVRTNYNLDDLAIAHIIQEYFIDFKLD